MYSQLFAKAHYRNFEKIRLEKLLIKNFSEGCINLLEIGFGDGKYLHLAREIGYKASGVEVNSKYIDKLREDGFSVYTHDAIGLHENSQDVLLLSHIIEHLDSPDLLDFFKTYIPYVRNGGLIIIATPLIGQRFYHDFSHRRPYYPQSIWHAFGGNVSELSYTRPGWFLDLIDLYFVKDCLRTRLNRSYYISRNNCLSYWINMQFNAVLAWGYLWSNAHFGKKASWIGVYKIRK